MWPKNILKTTKKLSQKSINLQDNLIVEQILMEELIFLIETQGSRPTNII